MQIVSLGMWKPYDFLVKHEFVIWWICPQSGKSYGCPQEIHKITQINKFLYIYQINSYIITPTNKQGVLLIYPPRKNNHIYVSKTCLYNLDPLKPTFI